MRSFIISIVVFAFVTTAVFVSAGYVRRSCDEIVAAAEQLQPDSDLNGLSARWERERIRYRAIVGHTEVDPADLAMEDLLSRAASGDEAEFMTAKAHFIAAVQNIRSFETFSFDCVF